MAQSLPCKWQRFPNSFDFVQSIVVNFPAKHTCHKKLNIWSSVFLCLFLSLDHCRLLNSSFQGRTSSWWEPILQHICNGLWMTEHHRKMFSSWKGCCWVGSNKAVRHKMQKDKNQLELSFDGNRNGKCMFGPAHFFVNKRASAKMPSPHMFCTGWHFRLH